jgi:RES domain-containing protein
MQRAYRLTTREFAATAFSGEGARLFGGRWNSPGTVVVYAAENLSLAQLELLVRVQSEELLRARFCCVVVEFSEGLLLPVSALGDLPADWAAPIPRPATQILGDRWASEQRSVVLSVPSAVTAGEVNFMFNPAHPDFAKVLVHPAENFAFDGRLGGPAISGGKSAKQAGSQRGAAKR